MDTTYGGLRPLSTCVHLLLRDRAGVRGNGEADLMVLKAPSIGILKMDRRNILRAVKAAFHIVVYLYE